MAHPFDFNEETLAHYLEVYGEGNDADLNDLMLRRARRWGRKLTVEGSVRTFSKLARADAEEGANPRTGDGISFITLWFSHFVNVATAVLTKHPSENKDPEEYFSAHKAFLDKNRLVFTMMTVVAREQEHMRRRLLNKIDSLHAAAAAAGLLIAADPTDGYISSDSDEAHDKYRQEDCDGKDFLEDGYVSYTEADRKNMRERIKALRDKLEAKQKKKKEEDEKEKENAAEETAAEEPAAEELADEESAATMQDLDDMPSTPPALIRSTSVRRCLEFGEDE